MDWQNLVEWGLAVGIALGAKREMSQFRNTFKEYLDKLGDKVSSHEERFARIEARQAQIEESVEDFWQADTPVPVGFIVDNSPKVK